MENAKYKETKYSVLGAKKRLLTAFESAIILCLVSLFIIGMFVIVINDIYAFVKPEKAIKITLGQNVTLKNAAVTLEREGVIENPTVFTLYVKSKDKESLFSGNFEEIEFNSSMSYREILYEIDKARAN